MLGCMQKMAANSFLVKTIMLSSIAVTIGTIRKDTSSYKNLEADGSTKHFWYDNELPVNCTIFWSNKDDGVKTNLKLYEHNSSCNSSIAITTPASN